MAGEQRGAGRLVAIVEDNERDARLAATVLEADAFQTVVYATGGEALLGVAERRPDVILLDVQLPDIDGVEVLQRLREQGADVPVVAVTAYAMRGDGERFLAAGFDLYLAKPLDIASLVDRVLDVLVEEPG